jgi:hypothetical protein
MFQHYSKTVDYDEHALCKAVNIKPSKGNIAAMNSYLLSQVFDCILAFSQKKTINSILSRLLQITRIFVEKENFKLALHYSYKTMAIAMKYEKISVIYELLDINMNIGFSSSLKFKISELKTLADEHLKMLQKMELIQRAKILFIQSKYYIKNRVKNIEEIELLLRDEVINKANKDAGFFVNYYVYSSCFTLYNNLQDTTNALDYAQKNLQNWNDYPHMITELNADYLTSLSNITSVFLINRMFDSVTAIFNSISMLENKNEKQQMRFNLFMYNRLFYINNVTFDYASNTKLMKIIENLEPLLVLYNNPGNVNILHTNMMISYFLLGDFASSFNVYNKIITNNKLVKNNAYIDFSYRFSLLILLELDNKIMFSNHLNTIYHLLYSNKKINKFDNAFFKLMRSLLKQKSIKEKYKIFQSHLDEYKTNNWKQDNKIAIYFSYYEWIESKALGLDYRTHRLALNKNATT